MGLDYTNGCVNFRDVGAFVNLILGEQRLAEGIIFRGGSIDYIRSEAEIEFPKSIINLRKRPDFDGVDAEYFHFPMANQVERYDTTQKEVRRWLNRIIGIFENPDLKYPVLIHCLSGKDRTGIVVAALLLILGLDRSTIVEEYMLSEGEVREELVNMALDGMKDVDRYFERTDLEKVRKNVLNAI